MSAETKKCYLAVCEVPYESHKFKNAAVFSTRKAAEEYIANFEKLDVWDPPNEIIELPFLN